MLRNRATFWAHEDDKRSAAMTKSHWDYYGNLKPMMLFLTWTGLFSPLHNPHASTYLKIVTTASCILRLSVNIIILGVFGSSLFVYGKEKIVSHTQGMIFGFYNLVNVAFILFINGRQKMADLLYRIKEQSDGDTKSATKVFGVLVCVHSSCLIIISVIRAGFIYSNIQRKAFVSTFFPFRDSNSTESYVSVALFLLFLPSGEYFSTMYYNSLCILMYQRYKALTKELKTSVREKHVEDNTIELLRIKYTNIRKIVNKLNSEFAFYISFNLGIWMLMICALIYLAMTKFILSYVIYIVTLNVLLFLLLFTYSMLYSEVTKLFLLCI